jgi:hypothetical protein
MAWTEITRRHYRREGLRYGSDTTDAEWFVMEPLLPGPVAGLVGIEGGVVSGVFNLESSGVEASDWRPRHDEQYHEA